MLNFPQLSSVVFKGQLRETHNSNYPFLKYRKGLRQTQATKQHMCIFWFLWKRHALSAMVGVNWRSSMAQRSNVNFDMAWYSTAFPTLNEAYA